MSLKALRKGLSGGEEILSVTRKELSLPLSYKKRGDLKHLVSKTTEAQNFFLKEFSGVQFISRITRPRELRDTYLKEGLPKDLGRLKLQNRQWKICLDKAFETLRSVKALTERAVSRSLKVSQLSERQHHLVLYLLQRTELLQLILDGKMQEALELLVQCSKAKGFNPSLKAELTEVQPMRVFHWLRRRYRTLYSKNQRPLIRKRRTYHLDPNMYSFVKKDERCYIDVASLEPRKRIAIPLTNRQLTEKDFDGNIKLVLRQDGRVEIHRSIHSIIKIPKKIEKPESSLQIKAVDKGFTDLLHCSSGKKYGKGYGAKMAQCSDKLQSAYSGRAKMHSLVKNLEKKLGTLPKEAKKERRLVGQKILRIKKNNLGSLKINKMRERIKNEIQTEIGTAVNQLYQTEKPEVLGVEKLDFDGGYRFGKRINRLLRTWHKGLLQDALNKGAKMSRAQLEEVNPAYSSQLCRTCGAVDAKNRKGEQFDCIYCGYKEDANLNASLNLRDRIFDPEIELYTPYKKVKEILLQRHRMSLSIQGLKEKGYSSSANCVKMSSNDSVYV